MRRILVENARRKRTREARRRPAARGPRRRRRSPAAAPAEDLLALDEALDAARRRGPGKAELVKLRYFAGLTVEEAARGPRRLAARPPTATGPTPGPGCSTSSASRDRPESWRIDSVRGRLPRRFSHCPMDGTCGDGRHPMNRTPARARRRSSWRPWSSDDPDAAAGLPGPGLRRTPSLRGAGRGACSRPTSRPAASSSCPTAPPTVTVATVDEPPVGGPGHGHRPVQAAGADRRGRHGRRLHGRADRAGAPQGGR